MSTFTTPAKIDRDSLEVGFLKIFEDERLYFRFVKFNDRNRLDIRLFFFAPDNRWAPTHQGVVVPENKWRRFYRIVNKLRYLLKDYFKEKKVLKKPVFKENKNDKKKV